jgi:hypothetical protein
MTAIKDKLFPIVANCVLCFLELGEAKLQQNKQVEASNKEVGLFTSLI